jgi:hypothetical protein
LWNYRAGLANIRSLAAGLFDQVARQAAGGTESFLLRAQPAAETLAGLAALDPPDVTTEALARRFVAALRANAGSRGSVTPTRPARSPARSAPPPARSGSTAAGSIPPPARPRSAGVRGGAGVRPAATSRRRRRRRDPLRTQARMASSAAFGGVAKFWHAAPDPAGSGGTWPDQRAS